MYEFKHPKYYKNLRKLARLRNRDQAISDNDSTESRERAPDPGHKQRDFQVVNQVKLSSQSQASSAKLQAPGVKLSNQPVQASSDKHQAPSCKHQASSLKLQAQ